MGQEQSSNAIGHRVKSGLRKGKSVPEYDHRPSNVQDSSTSHTHEKSLPLSPGTSICSDSELPYISYTVNKPIGDSPKKKSVRNAIRKISSTTSNKNFSASKSNITPGGHNTLVVINKKKPPPSIQEDSDLKRLQDIPTFVPIIRSTLHNPSARDADVLHRLDHMPLGSLSQTYQTYLKRCACQVYAEQIKFPKQISQIDKKVAKIMITSCERQKHYKKNTEFISAIKIISQQLEVCQRLFSDTVDLVNTINDFLPFEEQLESFVLHADSPARSSRYINNDSRSNTLVPIQK